MADPHAQATPVTRNETMTGHVAEDSELALELVIARWVRGYRLQQGLTVGELAERSGLSKGMLSKIENAQASASLASLARLASALAVPVTAFFRGLDEERDVVLVKDAQGLEIQHPGTRRGRYELLGVLRAPHNRMEPVLVTLTEPGEVFPSFQHPGTEIIYMLQGVMEYGYGRARYLLEPGDTLQFSGEVTHGPQTLIQLPIRFLSIKCDANLPTSEKG